MPAKVQTTIMLNYDHLMEAEKAKERGEVSSTSQWINQKIAKALKK